MRFPARSHQWGTPVLGTLASDRSLLRSIPRAAFAALCLGFAASIDAGALPAQGAPPQGGQSAQGRAPMRRAFVMRTQMRGRSMMMMGMMSDPAARLLDAQSMLQLSGAQVNQLIALHESTRKQSRAVMDQIRAMFPRPQEQNQGPQPAQRPRLSQQQRDNLGALMDSLRTIRWRATRAADSVLTTDQRHMAMHLAMAGRDGMGRGRRGFGGRGGMMMQRMGPGGMRMPRSPNDSGPSEN
ncbi:MAG TPA: hypothetical protein VF118_14785 [Gemmatimonadaceae bacterium]